MTYPAPDTIPLQPAYVGKAKRSAERSDDSSIGTHITGFTGAPRLQTFQQNAAAVASLLLGLNSLRRTVTIKNGGTADVFIGDIDVTVSNGFPIAAGVTATFELSSELHVVTASTTELLYVLTEMDG